MRSLFALGKWQGGVSCISGSLAGAIGAISILNAQIKYMCYYV